MRKNILITLAIIGMMLPQSWAQQNKPGGIKSFSKTTPAKSDAKKSAPTSSANPGAKTIPFAQAEPEDITNENYPDLIDSFDYPNAEITDVIKAISELTGKNFIIDSNVRGKISIIAPTQITVAEAYKAFLTALAVNGYTVVPAGKFLKIMLARNAQKDSIETYSGPYSPDADIMITRIVQCKYISADELTKTIRTLTTKDGTMFAYAPTNSIIISDFGSNIDRLVKIIERLDVPGFEEKMEVVPVKFGRAKDIADLVDQILDKDGRRRGGGRGGTTFSSAVPRFSDQRTGDATSENYRVVSDDRTNSLIIVGNQGGINKVKGLIKKLDYRIRPEDAGGVHVYHVKYGEAESISNVLSGITQKGKSSSTTSSIPSPIMPFNPVPASEAVFGGDVKISADKTTNSLIITASTQDYQVVLALLKKIDIPRDQIFVEAIIMEMNANKANNYGVSFFKYGSDNGMGRIGWGGGNEKEILNPLAQGGILSFATGNDVTITLPTGIGGATAGQTMKIKSLMGLLNILKSTTDANVLSNPQIMALNNEKATIEVGQEVPVGQNTQVAAGGVSNTSVERKKATIKLVIEPFISPDTDKVRMKVDQKVVDVAKDNPVGATTLAANTVSLNERSLETAIVVRSGDTAVLGGLIRNQESVTINKVPVLGDIPILGWLFKSQNTDVRKTNLLVFLTPKIMRADDDNFNMVVNKLQRRAEFIRDDMAGRDPYGKDINKIIKHARVKESNDEIIDETLKGDEIQ